MRSPLEHEPEFVAAIGLITVRWAVLESALADLLGSLFKVNAAGDEGYYAIGNFSQRLDLVDGVVRASFVLDRDKRIALAVFDRIRRLWKTRNALIHSHYVYYANHKGGGQTLLQVESSELGRHPSTYMQSPSKFSIGRGDGSRQHFEDPVIAHGFGYEGRNARGERKIVPINKGTFLNHAEQVAKRARQVGKITKAVSQQVAWVRPPSVTTHRKLPPRSRLNRG